MIKKKNKLTTSARPVAAIVELDAEAAAQVNGGQVFGIAPLPHPVFGVIVKPPTKHHHHKKPPFFGVPVHP